MKGLSHKNPRMYPDRPYVAVGILVVDIDSKDVLLIKRASEPGKGKYSIPGGLVEVGEKLIDAAKRELKEETSIDCKILGIIHVDEVIVRDRDGRVRWHYILIDFLAEPLSKNARASSDAEEAVWVSIDKALELNLTKSTRRLIEKLVEIKDLRAGIRRL